MKKYLYIFLLLFCALQTAQAQTKKLDSLLQLFKDVNEVDSVRYQSGLALAKSQMRISVDSSRITAEKVLAFAKETGNKTWQADAAKWIGITHAQGGAFQKANEYFFKTYELVQELNDKRGLAIILGNIGTVFYEIANYPEAQDYILKSLKLAEELGDEIIISRALNNLGNVNYDQGNNKTALGYYQLSLEIKEKLGLKSTLPLVHNNIGLIHSELGNRNLAVASYNKSISFSKELKDLISESRAYSNLGVEFSKIGEHTKALEYMDKGIQMKIKVQDNDGLASAYVYRGKTFLEIDSYAKAREDCKKGLDMSLTSGAINLQKEACECLSNAYRGLGNYKTALDFSQRYAILKDSLFNKERTRDITRAEMNYQFEKKQLADSIKFHKHQTQQKVAYEQKLNKQNTKFYILLMVSLAVIGFLTFLYYKYRQNLKLKKVENQLLNSEIEFKKKDLTTMAVNISNNQEWAESLGERLQLVKSTTGRKRQKELELLEEEIKNKIWVNKDSDDFYQKVDELSSSFYARLNKQFQGLTKTEVRLCSFIKLDLNTKQIATLQNINPSSVKMSRNRLRKKLNLTPEDDLSAFLRAF